MFADLLRRAASQFATRPAVREGERQLSYALLFERCCRLARMLAAAGISPGDRVASLGRNRLESVEEAAGVALGGFVRSPLYRQDTPERQLFMLQRVGATALLVDADCWAQLKPVLVAAGFPLRVVFVRDAAAQVSATELSYDLALAQAAPDDPMIAVDPRAPFVVRFTAGTTGLPKPVVHSGEGYYAAGIELVLTSSPLDETDSYLAVSPYSHASGNLVWPCISAGACHEIVQGFNAAQAFDLIEAKRCTTLFLVPTMIQRLLADPRCRERDVSGVRRIFYGAAPIPAALIRDALQVFGDVFHQLYGQSEIVPLTVLPPWAHRPDANGENPRLRSAGRATPNSFLRIEGADGTVLPPGEVGEIVASSPGVMLGIWGDEKATAERFTADGWIRTRDAGYLDADGFLYVMDRLDDLIISGGFKIAPAEIEDALSAHPQVAEAVAFGIPHPRWGSTPMAVVRLRTAGGASSEELLLWCQQRVGSLKKPTVIRCVDAPLPASTAGKLLRRAARDLYYERP